MNRKMRNSLGCIFCLRRECNCPIAYVGLCVCSARDVTVCTVYVVCSSASVLCMYVYDTSISSICLLVLRKLDQKSIEFESYVSCSCSCSSCCCCCFDDDMEWSGVE